MDSAGVAVTARFADWLGINQDLDFQPNISITSICTSSRRCIRYLTAAPAILLPALGDWALAINLTQNARPAIQAMRAQSRRLNYDRGTTLQPSSA